MKIKFLVSIIISIFLISCTEEISWDSSSGTDFPDYVVVEGYLSTDTTEHLVSLHWSKHINDLSPSKPISGAQIIISGEGAETSLTEKEPGMYYTPNNFYGVQGGVYHLTIHNLDVDNDGHEDVIVAKDSIPIINSMDSIKLEWFDRRQAWIVNVFAQEPPIENFYLFKAFVNNKLVTDSLREIIYTDDEFFNGKYINGLSTYWLDSDKKDEDIKKGDTVTLEIEGVSKNAFTFIRQAIKESGSGIPMFSGPPSNVEGNVIGKNCFGFFLTYSSNRSSVICDTTMVKSSSGMGKH